MDYMSSVSSNYIVGSIKAGSLQSNYCNFCTTLSDYLETEVSGQLWNYDPLTKIAYADLRAIRNLVGGYELEVTNNMKSIKNISIINPETISWTLDNLVDYGSVIANGGTA
jgi:hypothetical protein